MSDTAVKENSRFCVSRVPVSNIFALCIVTVLTRSCII